jgi:hypothetical protein
MLKIKRFPRLKLLAMIENTLSLREKKYSQRVKELIVNYNLNCY